MCLSPSVYSGTESRSSFEEHHHRGPHRDDESLGQAPTLSSDPWFDFAAFFLANYVSYAATVKSERGEPLIPGLLALVLALVFPNSGIIRGLSAAIQCAVTSGSPLETASRAGALCTVVRSPGWKPQHGDLVRGVRLEGMGRGPRRSLGPLTKYLSLSQKTLGKEKRHEYAQPTSP
jgi:hypothetical protein